MTKKEELEIINNRCRFNTHNGIIVTDVEDGCSSVVEAELTEDSMNPWGSAHGGLLFAMCDVAAGVAVMGAAPGGVTQSASMYYLRPASGKRLRAEGKVIKNGRTIALIQTAVYNDDGELAAHGEFEYYRIGAAKVKTK